MNRAIGVAVVAFGCGGSPKPAPVTAPPPPPPAAKESPAPVVAKGGDPCDGGEIASRAGERTNDTSANPSSGGLAGIGGGGAETGAGAGAPGGGGIGGAPRNIGNGPTGALAFGDYNFGPGLDNDGIKRVFSRNRNRLLYCFNTALQRDPRLSGTVTLDIAIEKTGLVSSAHAEGVDDGLDRCIQHGVTSFQLPAAKQSSHLTVRLLFAPA
ncbi:MAG TPA: AgmX/PglI C-terminal domain-containing protein [Kofleriaceae bacterium]|nr:AgmX/PglI C-terminal domain-containing protein [Kofleriaceae bacterium]